MIWVRMTNNEKNRERKSFWICWEEFLIEFIKKYSKFSKFSFSFKFGNFLAKSQKIRIFHLHRHSHLFTHIIPSINLHITATLSASHHRSTLTLTCPSWHCVSFLAGFFSLSMSSLNVKNKILHILMHEIALGGGKNCFVSSDEREASWVSDFRALREL